MGRPPLPIKRDQQLNLKLTRPELELVKTRAEAFGLRPIDYGRAVLLSEQHAPVRRAAPVSMIERSWLVQLRRLGQNLNQLVRRMHAFEEPAPPSLEPLLRDIRRTIDRVHPDDR